VANNITRCLLFFIRRKDMVDSTKIHGCIYELLKFNNIEEWGGALEVLAGGVLGHLVVEDENTGKALLKAGLGRRMNIHPLSVFKSSNTKRISQQDLDRQLGQGKAVPAIDLMQCDPRYKPIIQHFFGGKVFCDTIETAKV
jgi:chromosome segregation ATPase